MADFKEKHPRAYGTLYQAVLYGVTFQCAIAMVRYLPYSLPSDIDNPLGNATNSTTERMCKWGAREEDADVGPVAVSRSPHSLSAIILTSLLPYFILCPSTFTIIMSTIIFFTGIIRLQYLNHADIWQSPMMFFGVFNATIVGTNWHRVLMSIQISLPINIWVASIMSALLHPVWRWALPGHYAKCAEIQRAQREEWARKRRERKRRREGRDLESGVLGEGEGSAGLNEVDESTPLTGRGFVRMRDGAYVELPHARGIEVCVQAMLSGSRDHST
jgi:hypothetical protein